MNSTQDRPHNLETPCFIHDMAWCGECNPPTPHYRRGTVSQDVPSGHYIEVQPGKGVYHHPDCFNATGEWDGADLAVLGKRLIRSRADIRDRGLRPAQCCEPPTIA